jgi:hypothetical protein
VIIAGLLTEVCVVLVIVVLVTGYKYALSPTDAAYQAFANRVGYYIGVFGGALLAFLFALWVSRALKTDFLINGFLAGCVAVLLHVGLLVASRTEFQAVYAFADALKLGGGALGGYLAQRRFSQSVNSMPANHAP